jgi:sugar lactone lactonase YvrE
VAGPGGTTAPVTQGRFWAGSMADDTSPGVGSLYRMDHDARVIPVRMGVTSSNGLGWSRDGTAMYSADSGAGALDAFDFDGAGGARERRWTLVRCEGAGFADGFWVDDEGCRWVAMWGGGGRRPMAACSVPCRCRSPSRARVASPARDGGPLIVTTARLELSAEVLAGQPAAGQVLAIDAGTTGPAATPYRPYPGVLP